MTQTSLEMEAADGPASPTFAEAFRVWTRIGLLSFGGPAAQIALMHRIIVDERKWLTERQYLGALSFCMLLPGPEATQLAAYAGWRLHGVAGGLAAGLMFVAPGALVILALASVYAAFGQAPLVEAMFLGVKAAVLVIVVEALLRVARRALRRPDHWALAALSFAAIFFLAIPFPLIVLAAAVYGLLQSAPGSASGEAPPIRVGAAATLRTIALWLAVWLVPLLLVTLIAGPQSVLSEIGWFFSKLAVVTFGGAYAVLAYMAQEVVVTRGWLEAGQMMDGLGLAETTPGPLILVTEFVAFLAAYKHGGEPAWVMGALGAAIALWATFAPCFLWIFAGAPYIEWIDAQPRLKGALTGITAAVVGVILNLAVWFALHVLFREVTLVAAGPLQLWTPTLGTLDWQVALLSGLSGYLLLVRHWSMVAALAVSAALALLIRLV